MTKNINMEPELVVEYTDPLEGFKGWLVMDSTAHTLCAGGLRVQKGLTRKCVENLAATMTLKMRIAGIRADGAKSGIDYDPASPNKEEALFRFIRAIKPFILERYSMGPDLNTSMPELDGICSRLGIRSIKAAIAKAQNLNLAEFSQRIALLSKPAGHATLGRLRAGAGVAASCLGTLDFLDIPAQEATVIIQGFGGLATGAAYFLDQAGVKIIGLADHEKSLIGTDESPLDIPSLLSSCENGLLPSDSAHGKYGSREDIYNIPCDIFVPAAIEKAIRAPEARTMRVRGIACGANLAVTAEAEKILHERGVILIPDMVAGCGGSISMQGLFAPKTPPSVEEVLAHVDRTTRNIVKRILERSQRDGVPPRSVALQLCAEAPLYPDSRPYELESGNESDGNALQEADRNRHNHQSTYRYISDHACTPV